MVFVGSGRKVTDPDKRGRVLGIAEVGDRPYKTTDLVSSEFIATHQYTPEGKLRWPVAFAMTRAWRIVDPPRVVELFGTQLPLKCRMYLERLSDQQSDLVRNLEKVEQVVPASEANMAETERMVEVWGGRPTTGPLPIAWSGNVEVTYDWPATTYVLRFGKRDVWKIGWAKSSEHRLRQVNRHIPFEALNERWELYDHVEWSSPFKARDMEQNVLSSLKAFRTDGERLGCTPDNVERAWRKAAAS